MFKEITVKSQQEFDNIPVDFHGRIFIEFGTRFDRAIVNRRFDNAVVVAWENSSVVARGNSSVVARGNSSVEAWGNSSVEAWENSSVVAWENSSVVAWENSSVVARENSSVVAWENSSVVARGNSSVVARGNSSVVARGNSSVVAWENSSVVAWGNSSVEAWGNSSVEAWENSQICDCTRTHQITTSANARIVYNPQNIEEYCEHYGIERANGKVKLYKAVRKIDGRFFSDRDPGFEYIIGEMAVADGLTTDTSENCGQGIHMAYKEWCIDYGRDWNNIAIIEVEADEDSIIVPVPGCGKVRAEKVKVLREIPLQECGLGGKLLAKKLGVK